MAERREVDKKELGAVFKKCIRFSWQVVEDVRRSGKHTLDKEILTSFYSELNLDSGLEETPKSVQSIALPVFMALKNSKDRELSQRNPWKLTLSGKERELVMSYYGLGEHHATVFHMTPSPILIPKMASYIAATYAFSTLKVPMVVSMSEIVQETAESYAEDTYQMALIKAVDLLVVVNVLDVQRGLVKLGGSVRSLFTERMYKGKTTVFMDSTPPGVVDVFQKRGEPTRADVNEFFRSDKVGDMERLYSLLIGVECYINFNTKEPLEKLNVSGTPISI